jgi:ribonuclease HII
MKAAKAAKAIKPAKPVKATAGPSNPIKPAKQDKAVSPRAQPVVPKVKAKSKPLAHAKLANTATATESTKTVAPAIMRPKKKPTKKTPPNLKVEQSLWADGHEIIVGIDEVGRGSWAGPLSIGAVVLPKTGRVNGVRDSKMLTEREREALFDRVAGGAQHWAVGSVSHDECDLIGMSAAQKLAAQRAIEGLGLGFEKIDRVLIDGNWDFVSEFLGDGKTQRIIKGDATCLTIASASVLAKVSRDRLMRAYDPEFPGFNFAENKGYPCPKHKMALQAYGPTAIHRRSWVFMDHLPWTGVPRIVPAHLAAGVSVDQEVLF